MKKALVLSAIAAIVAAPAFAQSSVTAYGRLNVSLERQKTGNTTDSKLQDNSSRLGFKGTEDLGGGLKAGFQIETGFNPATGAAAGTFWGRQSEVNLSGAFGTVRAGNFTSEAYFATADYVSMHNHDTGTSEDELYTGAGVSSSNKVAYRTPSIGGLVAELAVTEGKGNPSGQRGYDFASNYDAGALHLGLGYNKQGEAKQLGVRALYELGAITLGTYFQRDTNLAGDSRSNFRVSGMYTLGATELHLNLGKAGDRGDIANSGATQYTLGVNQNLSKRTKLYAFYTKVNNQAAASYVTGTAGADFSSLALGVRHNF